jgi:hypothetical protein
MGLFAFVVATVDRHLRANVRADLQSAANAAAVGSVADLPKGVAAVLRTAGGIVGSQKAERLLPRGGEQEIEIGYWDAAGQSFSTGTTKQNAVRIMIRVRYEQGLFAAFVGSQECQTEARAVAVLMPPGNLLIAQAGTTTTNAVR